MNSVLTKLGIREEVCDYFKDSYSLDNENRIVFSYGSEQFETLEVNLHRIPVSNYIWTSGNVDYKIAKEFFICSSAMEAIAFLSRHFHEYKNINHFIFISFGLLPNEGHFQFIRSIYNGKKINLLMGNDLLGRISDIKIAAGIFGHSVSATLVDCNQVKIKFRNHEYEFSTERLTLNAFEKKSKFRSHFRTFKSKSDFTYLDYYLRMDNKEI